MNLKQKIITYLLILTMIFSTGATCALAIDDGNPNRQEDPVARMNRQPLVIAAHIYKAYKEYRQWANSRSQDGLMRKFKKINKNGKALSPPTFRCISENDIKHLSTSKGFCYGLAVLWIYSKHLSLMHPERYDGDYYNYIMENIFKNGPDCESLEKFISLLIKIQNNNVNIGTVDNFKFINVDNDPKSVLKKYQDLVEYSHMYSEKHDGNYYDYIYDYIMENVFENNFDCNNSEKSYDHDCEYFKNWISYNLRKNNKNIDIDLLNNIDLMGRDAENIHNKYKIKKDQTSVKYSRSKILQWLDSNLTDDCNSIIVYSDTHATALFKNKDKFYYFDANSETGEEEVDLTYDLAELIHQAHDFDTINRAKAAIYENYLKTLSYVSSKHKYEYERIIRAHKTYDPYSITFEKLYFYT